MATCSPIGGIAAPPGHRHLEVGLRSHRCDERPGLRTQLHAELDSHLIGRVIDRPEPGDQATSGRCDRCGSVLKGLIGLFHKSRAVLPEPARYWARGRLVDLNQDAAALVEWEFDETLHQAPQPEHLATARWRCIARLSRPRQAGAVYRFRHVELQGAYFWCLGAIPSRLVVLWPRSATGPVDERKRSAGERGADRPAWCWPFWCSTTRETQPSGLATSTACHLQRRPTTHYDSRPDRRVQMTTDIGAHDFGH